MKTARRILAIGAHPDDLEILCGGTLAKYVSGGHKVFMAHLTNGDKGHHRILSAKLAALRQKEARAAGGVIKAEVISLGLPDAELTTDLPTRQKVVDLIRQVKPDLIITHFPEDYAPDHAAASQLVFDASFICTAPLIRTKHAAHRIVPSIYYMDTLAGLQFAPEEYVDITPTMAAKRQMLAHHRSQLAWLKRHQGLDMTQFIEIVARFRGLQAGVKYAEGFRRLHVWPRETTVRLLP